MDRNRSQHFQELHAAVLDDAAASLSRLSCIYRFMMAFLQASLRLREGCPIRQGSIRSIPPFLQIPGQQYQSMRRIGNLIDP